MSLHPRTYQHGAITGSIERYKAGDRCTLVVMATGTGKTIVAAHLADHFLQKGRILVLAHRDELIRQAVAKFRAVTGHLPAVEKAGERADEVSLHGRAKIVVSSFQTQNSGSEKKKRMHRFDPMDFSFLFIDEFHHILAPSYRAVLEYYLAGNPDLKVLGVTATADRADGEALGQVCQSVAYRYELPDAVRDGYLVPLRQKSVVIEGLDFSRVRTTAGDLNAADLEAAMMIEKPLHGIAHACIEVACGLPQHSLVTIKDDPQREEKMVEMLARSCRRRTLIFTVTVAHAERMAEIINRWIPGAAAYVDGEMAMDRRRKIFESFHDGQTQFLVNCMVATEGYDEPGIELVVMARPTKSRSLFAQMCGRGTRPLDDLAHLLGDMPDAATRRSAILSSAKPYAEILDFVGNAGRHKLVSAADILGGNVYSEEVIELANELAQEQSIDVQEALDQAQEQVDQDAQANLFAAEEEAAMLEEEEQRRRIVETSRRAALVATASYHVEEIDPLNDSAPRRDRQSVVTRSGGASDKQINLLVNLGVRVDTARSYSMRQASAVIESMKAKKCTVGQAGYLRRLGYGAEEISRMNFDAASAAIDASSNKRGAA